MIVGRGAAQVKSIRVGDKTVMAVPGNEGVVMVAVEDRHRFREVLLPEEVDRLADLGCRVEAHAGLPQDVEWAVASGELLAPPGAPAELRGSKDEYVPARHGPGSPLLRHRRCGGTRPCTLRPRSDPQGAPGVWQLLRGVSGELPDVDEEGPGTPAQRPVRQLGVPHDPYATALAEGFIRHEGHPLDNLLPEIQATYPVVGYGVDLEVAYGLEKIWPFFPHLPQPAARAYAMPSLPDAVKAQAGYFEKYGLEDFSLFALDYRNRTINLYFMVRPGHLAPETIAGMIGDLGFQVPGQEILGYCSMAIPVYFTFSWDSPRVERLCFATVAFDERMLPTHLHPLIDRYCAGAPFAVPQRTFIFNLTFTRKGDFIKIENDYTGSMTDLMRVFS